jgi:hypothetical protein
VPPSPWVIVAFVTPSKRWLAIFTDSNSSCGSVRCPPGPPAAVTRRYERFNCSHISDEMISRTERAFSRAARRHE